MLDEPLLSAGYACAGAVWVSKLRWDSCQSTPGGGHLPANGNTVQDGKFACALCMCPNPGGTLARAPQAGDTAAKGGLFSCMRAVHVSKLRWDPCQGTPGGGQCSEYQKSSSPWLQHACALHASKFRWDPCPGNHAGDASAIGS